MQNIVCVKEVADPQDIEIEQGGLSFDDVRMIMNPYDEYAVEEVVRLKERFGYPAMALSIGSTPSLQVIKTAVALGVEFATEILTDTELDSSTCGMILAKAIEKIRQEKQIGLIVVGRQSIDQAKGQVGCEIAEQLNLPYISNVVEIMDLNGEITRVKRKDEHGYTILQSPVPCVIQVSGGEINEPRMPTIRGLFKAKKFVSNKVKAGDLIGVLLRKTRPEGEVKTLSLEPPPARQKGKILEGEPETQVQELMKHILPLVKGLKKGG